MKNFPHQVNQIPKIKGALRVAQELAAAHQDVGDDGVLGYAVARAGIYSFRNLPTPSPEQLERAISREQSKPLANQGPRTFARDLRRTLVLLGFLEHSASSAWLVSVSGLRVLELPDPPDPQAASLWREAVLNVSLSDTSGAVTHPARSMLRMVARAPGLNKRWLAFALDMWDDSDAELDRVVALQRLSFGAALGSVGAGEYMAANAVKILPSLLEQLGLMSIQGGSCTLTLSGVASAGVAPAPRGGVTTLRLARRGRSVAGPSDVTEHSLASGQARSTEDQIQSAALLEERTSQHQQLVRRLVSSLRTSRLVSEIRVSDDAFDAIAFNLERSEVLLIEAKTLREDALLQARIALGQLLFYEYFDVRPIAQGLHVRKIVAFDAEPGQQTIGFLSAYDVDSVVSSEMTLRVSAELQEYFPNA